jgi:hypothetical protein
MAGGQDDGPNVRVITAVGSAGRKGIHPHLFVGQAVRAYDGSRGKVLPEFLNVSEAGKFQINDGHISAIAGDGMPQLVDVARECDYPKVVLQGVSKRFSRFRVALRDNYTEGFHMAHPHEGSEAEALGSVSADTSMLQGVLQVKETTLSMNPGPLQRAQAAICRSA